MDNALVNVFRIIHDSEFGDMFSIESQPQNTKFDR